MMHQYLFLIGLITGLLFPLSNTAQTIKTAKDSAIFIQCAKLPKAVGEYNLAYTARSFDLNYIAPKNSNEKSLEELLSHLNDNPKHVNTSLNILYKYKALGDQTNYETYLNYTYKQAVDAYQLFPDSFELAETLIQLFNEGQNRAAGLAVLEDYIKKHPKDVRGLTQLALTISLTGQLDKAKELTRKAYEIAPKNHLVYFAAMMCELANILQQLGPIITQKEISRKALNKVAPDPTLFKLGLLNGDPIVAQMGLDIANLFVIYYRTISVSLDKEVGKEEITISPIASDEKMLKAIEKRAREQIKDQLPNLEAAYKILCFVEILRNHKKKAAEHWKTSGKFLEKNDDIPRFISLLYLFQLDFENAIVYTKKVLAIAPNYNDYYVLGRLYSYQKNWEKAYDAFETTRTFFPSDHLAVCAKVATRIHQHQFSAAFQLLEGYSSEITDNIDAHHINYFTALATLAHGNKNDAFKRLKAIHAQSEYKKDAEQLLAHFFKPAEED